VPLRIRPIRPDELATWFEASATAFYIWQFEPHALAEARRDSIEIERTVAAFDGETIVGTFRTFEAQLTLPGGRRVPVSSVTGVTVRPTHRRSGILSRLIADDVRRATKHGAVAGVLIASEWPIYGRFGYGPATWAARWTLRVRDARFEAPPVGSVEIVPPLAARKLLPGIYDAYAASQPGELSRPHDARWDFELGLVEWPGRPRWRGSVAIHRDATGAPDGYARYHGDEVWEEGIPDNRLVLDELHAATPAAELDLWRFLAQMDLTATIRADTRREHEPLPWHLVDARAAQPSQRAEFLWLRPFDVARLLGERTYERDGDLVLDVTDDVDGKCGPAAGRYRLTVRDGAASCRPTDAEADLTIDARALGAASLGGTRIVDATRAGGAVEHRAGALAEADRLFRTAEPPWCSTWF
jgi:predicted acetyltransferase